MSQPDQDQSDQPAQADRVDRVQSLVSAEEIEAVWFARVADEFGWLSADEMARLGGIGSTTWSLRQQQLKQWDLWVDSDAGPMYPGFFLADDPVFGWTISETTEAAWEVLKAADPECTPWEAIGWMITPNPVLEGARPVDVTPGQAWVTMRRLLAVAPPVVVCETEPVEAELVSYGFGQRLGQRLSDLARKHISSR